MVSSKGLQRTALVFARSLSLMPLAGVNLIERDGDFKRDQKHDDDLQPQRTLCIDDVGERGCGLCDDLKLSVQRLGPFAELVFVFEARVEPLEVGPVPEHVRLLANCDPARQAMLNQEGVADQLEQIGSVS